MVHGPFSSVTKDPFATLWMLVPGILHYLGLLAVTVVLHLCLPASVVTGYVCSVENNKPLMYRLNGLRVLVVTCLIQVSLWLFGVPGVTFLENFWGILVASNVVGITLSIFFYWKYRFSNNRLPRCNTADRALPSTGSSEGTPPCANKLALFFYDVFCGMEWNPRWPTPMFDWKMFSYLFGAVLLQVFLVSGLLDQLATLGYVTVPMVSYVGMFSWFCVDYMYNEHIHLYTYDLFAERLGFKLLWGCFFFYPCMYPIGIWALLGPSRSPQDADIVVCVFAVLVFLSGWCLSRGANSQKYLFKVNPKAKFLGLIEPKSVGEAVKEATDKKNKGCWLTFSQGEILMAVALAIPGGIIEGALLPWAYPIYYCLLLLPRERDDNQLCKLKYGKVWDEYCKRVPYRIIPFVY